MGDEVNDEWVKDANGRLAEKLNKKSPMSAKSRGKQPVMSHPRRGGPMNLNPK